MRIRCLLLTAAVLLASTVYAQFDRTRINFVCPCTFTSEDGASAELSFAVSNLTNSAVSGLYATVAISGQQDTSPGNTVSHSAYLDTIALDTSLEPQTANEPQVYAMEIGVIPAGSYFFELLLHAEEEVNPEQALDSVWFHGERRAPLESLDLVDANYLIDSDEDGVADLNETLEGTDPMDANDYPPVPVIDALLLHDLNAFENFPEDVETVFAYLLTVTEDMFARSGSPIRLRAVGLLDPTDVPEIESEETLSRSKYLELLREYQADFVATYRPSGQGLCGFAVDIGGFHNKGFLHPDERFPYIELFMDPTACPIDVTAHEIGHLIGLGHSFEQYSVGTYNWSRGHGVHGEFGTIMTYAEFAYNAIAVDVFSNPHEDCFGKPCGVPHTEPNSAGSADAAQSINVLKYQFARTSTPSADFDFDGDGVAADADAFPIDPTESADSDDDGFGDNRDVFPNDPLEWADTDADGIGDNTDPDIDNDGILNAVDVNPFDADSTSLRLTSVKSETRDDAFGYYTTRVPDYSGDDVPDLAVSAPGKASARVAQPSAVYLFSLTDFVARSTSEDATPGVRTLAELAAEPDTWVIRGRAEDLSLGQQLAVADHADAPPELVIRSDTSIYLVDISKSALESLDQADEVEDRKIDLTQCAEQAACTRIDFGAVKAISLAALDDFDGDARDELAVVVNATDEDPVTRIYVYSRAGIANAADESQVVQMAELFDADNASFQLTVSGGLVTGELARRSSGQEGEADGFVVGLTSATGETSGRVFVVAGEQPQTIADLDSDGDRIVALDELVASTKTYRVEHPDDPFFGYVVNAVASLDDDANDDIMVWGRFGLNYLMTTAGIALHDFNDQMIDGSVVLNEASQSAHGTWIFNRISATSTMSATRVLRPSSANGANRLVVPYFDRMLTATLTDLDHLDDPQRLDLNGVINLPVRVRFPEIYEIRAPFGPNGAVSMSGVTSLGDLDGDETTDLAYAVHSADTSGEFSTMYAVFSSELALLDESDGDTDGIVMLHNNEADTDGDGTPNLHDRDDDGDGLRDLYDVYPLLAEFKYDADFDGYANALDAFPLDYEKHSDIDNDGIADAEDDDADGDGVPNAEDPHPYDTDNDGIPNDEDADDDNDGVLDVDDVFPLDPSESMDSDGDGVGDNGDAFALDPEEWLDTDADGIGNNADPDDDNDGYLDADDAFPLLASEWLDTDGDGVGDNSDAFPNDPLEWEDLDGDGVGDNASGAVFTSYRLVTEWAPSPDGDSALAPVAVVAFRLGDIDRDGIGDIEIALAFPGTTGAPLLLLSGGDLATLDASDGSADRVIQLTTVHGGDSSWRFENDGLNNDALQVSNGALGDINGDGIPDLVVTDVGVDGLTLTSSITTVYGGDWAALDGTDGETDGIIDLHDCVVNKACANLRSEEDQHTVGATVSLLQSSSVEDGVSIAFSSLGGQVRTPQQNGLGAAYIVPNSAIAEHLTTATDGNITLNDILDETGVWTFFPEFVSFIPGLDLTGVGRLPDLDMDGTSELAIFTSSLLQLQPPRIYVVASSDLAAMDGADFSVDGRIDLRRSYRQPNSIRIDGFIPNSHSSIAVSLQELANNMSYASLFPLTRLDAPIASYLIDLEQLNEYDRAEGTPDGIIRDFPVGEHNAWTFPDATVMHVCKPDADGRVQALATYMDLEGGTSLEGHFETYVFDARDLPALDALDGTTDGSIDLVGAKNMDTENVWLVTYGSLLNEAQGVGFSCAGDLDNDQAEDIVIGITAFRENESRSHVIALTYADLVALDQVDGAQDFTIDASELWPQ